MQISQNLLNRIEPLLSDPYQIGERAKAILCSALHGNADAVETAARIPAWPNKQTRAVAAAIAKCIEENILPDSVNIYCCMKTEGAGQILSRISETMASCDLERDEAVLCEAYRRRGGTL
jgi:hypothetical protein